MRLSENRTQDQYKSGASMTQHIVEVLCDRSGSTSARHTHMSVADTITAAVGLTDNGVLQITSLISVTT